MNPSIFKRQQHSTESLTEKVPNLFPLKYQPEKKQNQVLDILQANLNQEQTDEENTIEAETDVEKTTLNRRLPEFYPGTHHKHITLSFISLLVLSMG